MDWILRRARLNHQTELVDIAIHNSRVVAIRPNFAGAAQTEWDIDGRVVLPGLVDLHVHLDKTYLTAPNQSGTLSEAIAVWRATKHTRTREELQSCVRRALETAIANGVTAMRTHVDTEIERDLETLAALLDLRTELRPYIDLQIVALGAPGCGPTYDAVIAAAIEMGADAIGGAPAIWPDPHTSIDAAFALAERTGKPIDLHIDETEDPASQCLLHLAKRTIAHGMQGLVTAGHCCSLAFQDSVNAARTIDAVAAAKLNIVTLPSCNLVLMGRSQQPVPRGATRVKELLERGVNVCAASDNVHDPFNPFGSYDPLQIANLTAHVSHMSGHTEIMDCLAMVTRRAARAFYAARSHDTSDGIAEGAVADLVVLDTRHPLDAVTNPPPRLATFKQGQLLVRTAINRDWHVRLQ